MVTHHPLTSLCWAQNQIQVSMGGGRDQHLVSSVSVWQPRRKHEGSNLHFHLHLRDAEDTEEQTAYSEGQEWQWGMDKAYFPALCCPMTFFNNFGQPCPGKALYGCAQLLRGDYFVSVALLFISPFLSHLEGIVLMSLFTSLSFLSVILSFIFLLNTNKPSLCCSSVQYWLFAAVHHSVTQTLRTRCQHLFYRCGARCVLEHTLVRLHDALLPYLSVSV